MSLSVLLTIIFAILKLCGVIAWSWWWVFSPLLIALVIWLLCIVLFARFFVKTARTVGAL